jgi:ubiquinone/menaquinone biosynthesis C-methylase UbiE
MSDTFDRSCQHWSEAGRAEMEAFYALASVDYRHLAEALDWKAWLEARQEQAGDRRLRLLDVACGSGKFPSALVRHAGVAAAAIQPVDYALLDPAEFSVAEARRALATPFVAGHEYVSTLQDLHCEPGSFDIVWATHALYALPLEELRAGLERFIRATGDIGFIAHASADAHYLRFYRHYLDAFRDAEGTPYTTAEQIIATLRQLGAHIDTLEINYENGAPSTQWQQVEGYLQRCVFDDSISLQQMLDHPITGEYLSTCRCNDDWRFAQKVELIFVRARTSGSPS